MENMISLILPYWDRQKAANDALDLLARHYQGLDLEILVIDDGNKVPFLLPDLPLNIRVIRLPEKKEPTSPLHAWNIGVKEAKGEIIALSCIEILHKAPVLEQMAEQLKKIGPMGYVLAAAWCPDHKQWHCHSSVPVPECPKGTGIGFMSMLRKELFNQVGGFDEIYMGGAGYEDRDFIWRLFSHGARFVIRDDLVVEHPKKGAHIAWKPEGFIRNEAIFREKWGATVPVTFLCLKAGDAYGPEYVNILYDMVQRNLRQGFPGRFVCLTDDPTGLIDGMQTLPLPSDLETWWGKLYMFKRGLFKDGERVVFLDLDTLILGNLEPLATYSGEFATLRDFYFPEQVGPAIIAWKAGGKACRIWEEWEACGKLRDTAGDLWWINQLDNGEFRDGIDILQDLYPGYFCSFKADCNPYPPKTAAVVCFHGQPKPHNCNTEWVENVWKIGGYGLQELEPIFNISMEIIFQNIRENMAREIPVLDLMPEHDRQAVIVSGGPSINETFPEIAWRKSQGATVIAVNGSALWLNERGIEPDIQIVIDARPHNVEFMKAKAKAQYLASQCSPSVFDAASNPTIFHMNIAGIADILPPDREIQLISSGTTAGLAAMAVAYTQGYRIMHLHGFDSSFEENHHAYSQPQNDDDVVVDVTVGGKDFKAALWMVKQAQQWQELTRQLVDAGCTITVAGTGLIPHIARMTQ